jgi:hypothetical protein
MEALQAAQQAKGLAAQLQQGAVTQPAGQIHMLLMQGRSRQ